MGNRAPCRCQPEDLRFAVEIAPGGAAFSPHRTPGRIDMDAAHTGKIDHQSALAYSDAWGVVAAAAHRDQPLVSSRKCHGSDHIRDASAARNERRAPIDHSIPNLAGFVIGHVARVKQWTT